MDTRSIYLETLLLSDGFNGGCKLVHICIDDENKFFAVYPDGYCVYGLNAQDYAWRRNRKAVNGSHQDIVV